MRPPILIGSLAPLFAMSILLAFALFGGSSSAPVDGGLPPSYADQNVPVRYRGKDILNKPTGFSEKVVALTYDDGPDPSETPKLLKHLKDYNAVATFFLIGVNVDQNPETTKAIALSGHVIGAHTYRHVAKPSRERAVKEMNLTAKAIHKATGQWPSTYRPPYGIRSNWTSQMARSMGYPVVLWNRVVPEFVATPSSGAIASAVITQAKPGDIVLMHDCPNKSATVAAAPAILDALSKKGFQFISVPEMLRRWDAFEVLKAEKAKAAKAAKEAEKARKAALKVKA